MPAEAPQAPPSWHWFISSSFFSILASAAHELPGWKVRSEWLLLHIWVGAADLPLWFCKSSKDGLWGRALGWDTNPRILQLPGISQHLPAVHRAGHLNPKFRERTVVKIRIIQGEWFLDVWDINSIFGTKHETNILKCGCGSRSSSRSLAFCSSAEPVPVKKIKKKGTKTRRKRDFQDFPSLSQPG